MADFSYTYTDGGTDDLSRLRLLIGDNRGVPGAQASMAAFITTSQAAFTDDELNDLLTTAISGGDIMVAAKIALQIRMNREALNAGVSGTTDTTDRPAAIINALRGMDNLKILLGSSLPQTQTTSQDDLDDRAHDMELA